MNKMEKPLPEKNRQNMWLDIYKTKNVKEWILTTWSVTPLIRKINENNMK